MKDFSYKSKNAEAEKPPLPVVRNLSNLFGYTGNPWYLGMTFLGLTAVIFLIFLWVSIAQGPGVAEAAIKNNIAMMNSDCKSLASSAVRLEILSKKRILSKNEINEATKDYAEMEGEECQLINGQIAAAGFE